MIENINGWIKGLDSVTKHKTLFNFVLNSGIVDSELGGQVRSLVYGQNGINIEEIKKMLKSIKNLFTNQDLFEPIIVSSPEDAVIRETHRLREELEQRLNIPNKYVIFNKVQEKSQEQKEKITQFKNESKTSYLAIPQLSPEKVNLQDEQNALMFLKLIIDSISPQKSIAEKNETQNFS